MDIYIYIYIYISSNMKEFVGLTLLAYCCVSTLLVSTENKKRYFSLGALAL